LEKWQEKRTACLAPGDKSTELSENEKMSGKDALIKKKIKFSSYVRKFRVEQLQSHI
jgi:hypothetical protein